jgi:hypothetical protein
MCYALFEAFLFQEFDNGWQDRVAMRSIDERFEDFLDGSSRLTVFVERVCFE